MIILITGPSHVGKTCLSQKLLEKYKYPYLSIDHLKMGLIRSKQTNLTPLSNDRTKQQNSLAWKLIVMIANIVGKSKEEVYRQMLKAFSTHTP